MNNIQYVTHNEQLQQSFTNRVMDFSEDTAWFRTFADPIVVYVKMNLL